MILGYTKSLPVARFEINIDILFEMVELQVNKKAHAGFSRLSMKGKFDVYLPL
jgi:hypothetical protein